VRAEGNTAYTERVVQGTAALNTIQGTRTEAEAGRQRRPVVDDDYGCVLTASTSDGDDDGTVGGQQPAMQIHPAGL